MVLLVSFVGTGLLITALAIPLALGNVPPNLLYGVRVRATRHNVDIWYYVNERSGRDQIVVGVLNVIAPALLYILYDATEPTYAYACMGVLFASLVVMMVRSRRYIRTAQARFGATQEH